MKSKLDTIAIDCLNREINKLETQITSTHVFSNEFETRMKQIISFGKEKEKYFKNIKLRESRKYVHISGRSIRRSLLVAIVAISILVSSIATIAITKPRFYFIIKENIHNWIIQFDSNEEHESLSIKNNLYIPNLPKGYEITSQYADDYSGLITMADTKHTISLQQLQPEDSLISKAIGENPEHIFVNGYDIIVSQNKPDTTFILTTDNFAYILDGNCDYDILYEMVSELITLNP